MEEEFSSSFSGGAWETEESEVRFFQQREENVKSRDFSVFYRESSERTKKIKIRGVFHFPEAAMLCGIRKMKMKVFQ